MTMTREALAKYVKCVALEQKSAFPSVFFVVGIFASWFISHIKLSGLFPWLFPKSTEFCSFSDSVKGRICQIYACTNEHYAELTCWSLRTGFGSPLVFGLNYIS